MKQIRSLTHAMSLLAEVRRVLAECTDVKQILDLRNQAEAIRIYVRGAALGLEAQNEVAVVKILCERLAGRFLKELGLPGGDRRSDNRDASVTLDELGISRDQSSRWQWENSLPDEDLDRYVRQTNEERREVTSNAVFRLAKLHAAAKPATNGKDLFPALAEGLARLACQQKRFACIYADPPWQQGKKTKIAQFGKALCGLPVQSVSAPQAHLHLWAPPETLEVGLAVLRAWGFRYQAALVRNRAPTGYGPYWRHEHDTLLLGVRGRLPFHDNNLSSWLDARYDSPAKSARDLGKLIALASPPPYLDLFGTALSTDWTTVAPA